MSTRTARWLALLGMGLASPPACAQVAGGLTGEISLGYLLAANDLGHTNPIDPVGYLRLADVDPAPSLGLTLVFPSPLAGVRLFTRLSYARSADVPAIWIPCEPGAACPAILIQPTVRASRMLGTAGLEIPVLRVGSPVIGHALVAAGVRRYGISWDPWGEGVFQLPRGSHDEWDDLGEAGLGIVVSTGPVAVAGRWSVAISRFGAGEVTTGDPVGTLDLGRRRVVENVLQLGVRRSLF